MGYDIIAVPKFKKQLKRLAKKHPSIKVDFSALLESLEADPEQGIAIGKNCYKIRLAIKSIRKRQKRWRKGNHQYCDC